jgi:hypothetical protein
LIRATPWSRSSKKYCNTAAAGDLPNTKARRDGFQSVSPRLFY